MDMRMSRSRISAGSDLRELQAQQLAQRGIKVKSPPPVPPLPEGVRAARNSQQLSSPDQSTTSETPVVTVTEEPEAMAHDAPSEASHEGIVIDDTRTPEPVDYSRIPPPPPLVSRSPEPQVQAPMPRPAAVPPTFKEPPPEDDDLPPRQIGRAHV